MNQRLARRGLYELIPNTNRPLIFTLQNKEDPEQISLLPLSCSQVPFVCFAGSGRVPAPAPAARIGEALIAPISIVTLVNLYERSTTTQLAVL
ncbi:hypothetical protein J6590_002715 [Homalodisca vitripennis]|nr:hypothetical protein J6590_002715 [Homalodisca vitripennis]